MINFFKKWFAKSEEAPKDTTSESKVSADEIVSVVKMITIVEDTNKVIDYCADKLLYVITSSDEFFTRTLSANILRLHNGVINIAYRNTPVDLHGYNGAREWLNNNGHEVKSIDQVFRDKVDQLMAERGYYPTHAKQIFSLNVSSLNNPYATDSFDHLCIGMERSYVKDSVDLTLKGFDDYARDFDAAKSWLAKSHFADRFAPVLEHLLKVQETTVSSQEPVKENPLGRDGMITVRKDERLEELVLSTGLSLGAIRCSKDKVEIPFRLDEMDHEFIYRVHDPRAVVTFLWEALDPLVTKGKMTVSNRNYYGDDSAYVITLTI
ncbi:hypothetical protein [Pectobacterium phage vB_ParM-25]|uniref:Uncharacterized protein n=2 Tax=Moabitevirus TaxID=2843422 RepID=A0A7T3TM17_9CAUD|nr:hypothetical protein [Serratia phage vB_SmaM_Yaphecito]UQT03642.1 hypothetical protein KODAMA_01750 [Serratia phage vB_SmaM-Kodama]URG14035.1 hypothetical protein [Pectobacterium phage vB_ParM-25]